MLLATACDRHCEPHPYSGKDVIPDGMITAEQLLAASELRTVDERSWIPDPSQFDEQLEPIPPLSLSGSTSLEITVTPLSDEFIDDSGKGCYLGEFPTAPVRVTVRTSDGVLDEVAMGSLSASSGAPYVFVLITEPVGSIKGYFAGFAEPLTPRLELVLRPSDTSLQLQIERRQANGASYEYVTLL
jgi:hypothetical protein